MSCPTSCVAVPGTAIVNVTSCGPVGKPSGDNETINCAIAEASKKPGSTLYFPAGDYYHKGTISLKGKDFSIIGDGCGTKIHAVSSKETILDLTDYVGSGREFRGFVLQGKGGTDISQKGLVFENKKGAAYISFRDIQIVDTAGECLLLNNLVLSHIENIQLIRTFPENRLTPYLHMLGPTNGNRFIGIGVRSTCAALEFPDGAIIIEDDGKFAPTSNFLLGWWDEFLHIPNNGAVLVLKGNGNIIDGWQSFDMDVADKGLGTAFFRIKNPSVTNYGGNEIRGYIPGPEKLERGIVVEQSRNRITGVKGYGGGAGYGGNNIELRPNVEYTYIEIGGAFSGVWGNPIVLDNSGKTNNTIIDGFRGSLRLPSEIRFGGRFAPASGDTAGSIKIPKGAATAVRNFSSAFATIPRVIITPRNDPGTRFWVTPALGSFTINLSTPSTIGDIWFDYLVLDSGAF